MRQKNGKKKFILLLAALLLTACQSKNGSGGLKNSFQEAVREYVEQVSEEDAQNNLSGSPDGSGNPSPAPQAPSLEVKVNTEYMSDFDDGLHLCQSQYDTLEINGQDYPELARALETYNADTAKSITDTYNELDASAKEIARNGSFTGPNSCSEDIFLCRADSVAFSFLSQYSDYSGGAHGSYYYSGHNYRTDTGEALKLEDVVTDLSRLPDLITEKLIAHYSRDAFFGGFEDTVTESIIPANPDYPASAEWLLKPTGLTFYYSPYELGPYASGSQNVTLFFAEYPDLFQEPYSAELEQFAVSLMPYEEAYLDVNGDKIPEQISISASREFTDSNELAVSLSGQSVSNRFEGSLDGAYIVKTSDNRYYLYADTTGYNDYQMIYVYNLTGNSLYYVGEMSGGFSDICLTNPEHFKIADYVHALSSYGAYKYYHVGNNGMPESDEESYTIELFQDDSERHLTTKIPVSVWMISEDGTVDAEPTQIPAGTVLYFRKTDVDSYVEMELQDDRHCQVRFEFQDWQRTIGGIDENDCFDGIAYAG